MNVILHEILKRRITLKKAVLKKRDRKNFAILQKKVMQMNQENQKRKIELEERFQDFEKALERYNRLTLPDKRKQLSANAYKEVQESVALELVDYMASVAEKERNWERYQRDYKERIKAELQRSNSFYSEKTILIICRCYRISKGMDAIRNEAFEVFQLLKRSSVYPVRFLSFEPDLEEILQEGEITFLPEKNAGIYIEAIRPALCIFFESTPNIIRVDHCSMILKKAIFRLSGQNPLQGVSQSTIEELTHLNDYGIHKYLVQSETAYQILVQNGFHEPEICYPFLNRDKIAPRKRGGWAEPFTIGFASSPMEESQKKDRGILLLCDMVIHLKQVQFMILWRYDRVEIPEMLQNQANCNVIVGDYPMKTFYSEIDCLLIPYESIDHNHACSLSGIEAMCNGIPVLCTEVSGISEIVKDCSMGECVSADWREMEQAIERIKKNYPLYSGVLSYQFLGEKLDHSNFIDLVEKEAEKSISAAPVTLYEWDRILRLHRKYLVKGHQSMKAYYQQKEIAANYTQDRFTSYALKCFDLFERQNLCVIVEDWFSVFPIRTLDIACGNGRITKECVKYGSCVAMDTSEAMLDIVKSKFQTEEHPPVVKWCDMVTDELCGTYDFITCFRYIRHFEYKTRKRFYKKILEHLAEGGLFVMDVPNLELELPLKTITGWQNYNIYDVFWTKEGILEELGKNGFQVQYLLPTGQGLLTQLPEKIRDLPMTWTVGAIKRNGRESSQDA